jgi:hypothetical protein
MERRFLLSFILGGCFCALVCGACGDDDGGTQTEDDIVYTYNAAAAVGDLVRYTINETQGIIEYENLTTSESGSMAYEEVASGDMRGALRFMMDGEERYVLAVKDQMLVTVVPFDQGTELVFGVNRDSEGNTATDYAGDYLFVHDDPDPTERGWGTFTLNADGSQSWEMFDIEGNSLASGSGTWAINADDPSLIDITDGSYTSTGMVLPGKMILIDNGPNMGIDVGIHIPDSEIQVADIAGRYVYVDTPGYGDYDLSADGSGTWNFTDYTGEYVQGSSVMRRTTPSDIMHYNNTLVCEDDNPDLPDAYVIMLPGEAMMIIYPNETDGMDYAVAVNID